MQSTGNEVTMPVTVQQIAAAIHRMSADERQELLKLAPELLAKTNVKEPAAKSMAYNFGKARRLLKEVKGELSFEITSERAG